MTKLETRQRDRDRVLMFAQVSIENQAERHRVRLHDLSPRGVRAEGDVSVCPNMRLEIEFGKAGSAMGTVAWCDGQIFGLALEKDIEPDAVRRATIQAAQPSYEAPTFVRSHASNLDIGGLRRRV